MSACFRCCLFAALALACAGAPSEPTIAPAPPPIELDVLAHLGIPPAFAPQIFAQLPEGRSLPANIELIRPDGTPAARETLVLRWDDGEEEIVTDDDGVARVALTADRARNPRLLVPADYTAAKGASTMRVIVATGSGPPDPTAEGGEAIDLDELPSLSSGNLEVFHPADAEADARDVLAELERIRAFAEEFTALELGRLDYGVVLVEGPERDLTIEGRILIPITLDAWRGRGEGDAFTRWPLVHEWIELSLVLGGLYTADHELRMAGDGVAELVSFAYCRRHAPWEVPGRLDAYLERVDTLLAKDHERYDFATSFPAGISLTRSNEPVSDEVLRAMERGHGEEMVAGYAVSFWFWHTLWEEAGEEAVRDLVRWLRETDEPTAKGLIARAVERVGAPLCADPELVLVRRDLRALRDGGN